MLKRFSSKNIALFEVMPVQCMTVINDHQRRNYLINTLLAQAGEVVQQVYKVVLAHDYFLVSG